MASVFVKVTASGSELHYIRFKDLDGRWKDKNSRCSTRKAAMRIAAEGEERVMRGQPFFIEPGAGETFGELAPKFLKAQHNRSKDDDESRMRCHLLPKWRALPPALITLQAVMLWIDDMKAGEAPVAAKADPKKAGRKPKKRLSEATMRHNLNLLSRFFGWAIERGFAQLNPVRQVPTGKRPRQAPKAADRPWIEDDDVVVAAMGALAPPYDLMLYLGNCSGLRPGETWGLRLSDFGFLDEGVIRVRYSCDGPLKEDKRGEGKVKWVPAADDCKERLAVWLKKRRLAGGKDEDFVFPAEPSFNAAAQRLEAAWKEASDAIGLEMTFYEATRHSFVSKKLAEGASLDEVSAAVGHSSPTVTRRFYDHLVRKTFSTKMRRGILTQA